MVSRIRDANQLLGGGFGDIPECERPIAEAIRRSVAAGRDLPAGHALTWEDLTWVRPASGVPVGEERKVLGLKLTCDLKLGELISLDDLSLT